MGLPKELVEKLACPQCHGTLAYIEKEDRLECSRCRLAFRVINDIPVLQIDEAQKLQ